MLKKESLSQPVKANLKSQEKGTLFHFWDTGQMDGHFGSRFDRFNQKKGILNNFYKDWPSDKDEGQFFVGDLMVCVTMVLTVCRIYQCAF